MKKTLYRFAAKSPISLMGPDMRQNLETIFGTGRVWSWGEFSAIVWTAGSYHVMWSDSEANTELQKLWRARKGRTADPLVLLAASDDLSKVLVIGPQEPQPVRKLDAELVVRLLKKGRGFDTREATAYLIREFMRLEESVVPGLRVKDLLTPHFVRERLRKPDNEPYLKETANDIRLTDDTTWRSLFNELGYRIEERVSRGYLLRHNNSPVAVVHPVPNPSYFGRLTENGELPEGFGAGRLRTGRRPLGHTEPPGDAAGCFNTNHRLGQRQASILKLTLVNWGGRTGSTLVSLRQNRYEGAAD